MAVSGKPQSYRSVINPQSLPMELVVEVRPDLLNRVLIHWSNNPPCKISKLECPQPDERTSLRKKTWYSCKPISEPRRSSERCPINPAPQQQFQLHVSRRGLQSNLLEGYCNSFPCADSEVTSTQVSGGASQRSSPFQLLLFINKISCTVKVISPLIPLPFQSGNAKIINRNS